MINNNNIGIKSIFALSGPHALQFGGAQQLRNVMARRAPEGGSGHNGDSVGSYKEYEQLSSIYDPRYPPSGSDQLAYDRTQDL